MTKLSERVPDTNYVAGMGEWLKELAEHVELTDRRDRLAYRDLRERLSKPPEKPEPEYEPQTYDEAIALCKGWRRCCAIDGFVHWEDTIGTWAIIDPDDKIGFSFDDYECYNVSWEKDKWPELWKEMNTGQLRWYGDVWLFDNPCAGYKESTPGRVVCQAYLVYKGYIDWAERLSRTGSK